MPDITSPLLLARRVPISPALPLIAVGAAAVVLASGAGVVIAALLAAFVGAAGAAFVDLRTGIVPDETVLVVAIAAVLAAVVGGTATELVAGCAIVGLPLLVIHAVSPAAMGFGDVKLGAALGAVVGLVEPRLGVVVLLVASASAIVAGLVTRRSSVPFAPALVFGALCTIAAAEPLSSILIGGTPSWR